MEEKILEVLKKINEDIFYYEGENLFDEGLLDSLQIIDLIIELEEALNIKIATKYAVEKNFKTKKDIVLFLKKLMEAQINDTSNQ